MLQQTQRLANSWIELIAEPEFNDVRPYSDTQASQLVLGWRDETLVLQQAPFTLKKPNENKTHRITIGDHKWALTSVCHNNACVITGLRDSERKYAVRSLMLVIFLPLLFIFCVAMLAMCYAVQYALTPLNQLAKQVSDVSVKELHRVTSTTTDQELTPLIHALNQLLDNMKKQLTKERQFLDTCTHELRTPVTALLAQIQNIQSLQGMSASNKQQLEKTRYAANRTVRVANQFLSLAKNNNADASAEQAETFDLCELTRQVIAEILTDCADFYCQMEGLDSLEVQADSLSMEMVSRNLVENAQRYGHSGEHSKKDQPHCLVTIDKLGETVSLIVEDSGPGVDAKHQAHLLERFYRVPENLHADGAGLGLSIVDEVAARYNGQVIIDSSEKLGGLRVVVTFNDI